MTIAVVDTNAFIKRTVAPNNFTSICIPTSVLNELKDEETRLFYNNIFYNLSIKEPSAHYRTIVQKINTENNLLLSNADIDVVALFFEMSEEKFNVWIGKNEEPIVFLSDDNGVKQAINILGLGDDKRDKKWMFRCSTCFMQYKMQVDFCRGCGYNTITRISYYEIDGKIHFNFKKNFTHKAKEIKNRNGIPLKSADQKEYMSYKKEQEYKERNYLNKIKRF